MRWIVLLVGLVGCLRACATVVHPTDIERTGGGGGETIARSAAPQEPTEDGATLGSIEVGALIPFNNGHSSTRVHLAPGVRIFSANPETVLAGLAVGADFANGFALEGSVHVGDGMSNPAVIDQVVDVFAGMTIKASSTTLAVGPSVGLLMMPGAHSNVMIGFGLRLTSE